MSLRVGALVLPRRPTALTGPRPIPALTPSGRLAALSHQPGSDGASTPTPTGGAPHPLLQTSGSTQVQGVPCKAGGAEAEPLGQALQPANPMEVAGQGLGAPLAEGRRAWAASGQQPALTDAETPPPSRASSEATVHLGMWPTDPGPWAWARGSLQPPEAPSTLPVAQPHPSGASSCPSAGGGPCLCHINSSQIPWDQGLEPANLQSEKELAWR